MDIRGAKKHAMYQFKAGNTVIWKSPPGMAKTACSFELHKMMQAEEPSKRIGLCRSFMATQTDVDATGLPWKGSVTFEGKEYTITDPAMPRWFISTDGLPACCYDKVLLVMEEWGQGSAETKRAFASVMLEQGVPGFYLPNGSHILALTNTDATDGVTKEFDFVIGRRNEQTISKSIKVWHDDFADKPYEWHGKTYQVSDLLKAWAMTHPDEFFGDKPKVQGPWSNPRSQTANDRYMSAVKDAEGSYPLDDPSFIETIAGDIGMPAAQSKIEFAKFAIELPSYQSVVMDPEGAMLPKKADLTMLMAYKMAAETLGDDLGAVLKYIGRMPKDMSITFVTSLMRRDAKQFFMNPALQAWVSKNATLMVLIQTLAA